ncbi:MAG: ATP synthase F0 subunit B [Deltaproteobacteria bacterium]|nr:ATP synthase F0 subunit B [Deltaproteobacteria bacterium]
MKRIRPLKSGFLLFIMVMVLTFAASAWGSEGTGGFRKTWDTVWLFINFGILVFFLVKYGRKPLMDFLRSHGSEIGQNLEATKELLAKARAEYEKSEERLAGLEQKIAELEVLRLEEAERAKQRILEEAEQSSKKILDEAREIAETEIKKAWAAARTELVEMAMEEAETMIREQIGLEDEARIIGEYVGRLSPQNQSS